MAFAFLFLFSFSLFPAGLRSVTDLLAGRVGKSNYSDILLATPAWCVSLPFAILALVSRQIWGRLVAVAGLVGVLGVLTMPCAWETVNRGGLSNGVIPSGMVGVLGLWLSFVNPVPPRF